MNSQVSEVKNLGKQLQDSCSNVDYDELKIQMEGLSTLHSELHQQIIQLLHQQGNLVISINYCH